MTIDNNIARLWYDTGSIWTEIGYGPTVFTTTTTGAVTADVYSYTLAVGEFVVVEYQYYADNAASTIYRGVNIRASAYRNASSIASGQSAFGEVQATLPGASWSAVGNTMTLKVNGVAGQDVRHRVLYNAQIIKL
jgi:hypothetical protein